jgi:hypothetical protein
LSAVSQPAAPRAQRLKLLVAREGCRAALLLLVILNALFFPFIWGHKSMLNSAQLCASILVSGSWSGKRVPLRWSPTLDGAAAAWFFDPSIAVTGEEYVKDRTIPLWNPYQAYGAPLAANMQSQPFYPLTILLSLHLTPYTYNLYILARLFVVGIFSYFYVRLFVSFLPAVAGGIAAMLGGYYVLYMTMPHISVEILIPAALFTSERFLRRRSYRSFLAFVTVLFLAIVGGMPESSFLLLVFLYIYIALRILSDRQLRLIWSQLALRITAASAAGLGLSCVVLLPFLEFMRHSFNTHDPKLIAGVIPGLHHFVQKSTIFTFFLPLIYGQWDGLTNYFGLVAVFLILVAVMTALRRDPGSSPLRFLTWFFFIYAVISLLKHYGIEPIQQIGRAPLFRYVSFYKYGHAVLSICVAILCAIGLERVRSGQATRSVIAMALAVSFAIAPLAFFIGREAIIAESNNPRSTIDFSQIAFVVAVCALFCLAICVVGLEHFRPALAISAMLFMALELSFNYVVPVYYLYNNLPDRSENPYAGAPYIQFLKTQILRYERVFGRNGALYPNWASVFDLQDIRDLDAMYYKKYLPFVRNFITPDPPNKAQEMWDRFTGDKETDFATPAEKRLLQLSSAAYVLTAKPYLDPAFKPIYDGEVRIYEYDSVLPRAAIYYRAAMEHDEGEVLKKLADPSFDVFQTVALDRTKIKPFQVPQIAEVNAGPARRVTAANITSYSPEAVEIHAQLDQSGILVLNDSDYPGWAVEIDGNSGRWVTANYMFRGVILKPGRHVVRFLYSPRTFYMGAGLAILTLLGLGVPGARRFSRAARPIWTRMCSPSQLRS